jgi:hypothetical protein
MRRSIALVALVALAACNKAAPPQGGVAHADLAATPAASDEAPAPAGGDKGKAVPVSLPQIAYTYSLGFQLSGDAIGKAEQAHVALCDRLGLARCHVVTMSQSRGTGDDAEGHLELAVDARIAKPFGDALVAAAAQAGGTTVDRGIEAEDLSKTIVDTQAHIRAKQALADRLMGVLQTHKGGVSDLVAAERALSDVQEEIDTAQSELAEAQGRVALSTYKIDYSAVVHFEHHASGPLGAAWSQMGAVMGGSLGALLLLAGAALPWLIVAVPIVYGLRRLVLWRRRRREAED